MLQTLLELTVSRVDVSTILSALDANPNSACIVSSAFRAIDSTEVTGPLASSLPVLDHLASALSRFPMVLCVNMAAVVALRVITSCMYMLDGIVQHPTLLTEVFSAMRRHMSSEAVLGTCCELIWNIAANDAGMKVPLVELGAIDPVCDALEFGLVSSAESALSTAACGALYSFSADPRNKSALLASRAVTLLHRVHASSGAEEDSHYWAEEALKHMGIPLWG